MAETIDIRELTAGRKVERMTKLEFEARRIYLESYISLVHRLEEMQLELEELEHDIGPGAHAADGMPRGGKITDGSDRIVLRMERRQRLRACIRCEIEELEAGRAEISRVIKSTVQGKLQEVLYYRYVRDMDLGEIADRMHYSYRQVQNLHNRALMRIKPPRRKIAKIKAELIEDHAEWANTELKPA